MRFQLDRLLCLFERGSDAGTRRQAGESQGLGGSRQCHEVCVRAAFAVFEFPSAVSLVQTGDIHAIDIAADLQITSGSGRSDLGLLFQQSQSVVDGAAAAGPPCQLLAGDGKVIAVKGQHECGHVFAVSIRIFEHKYRIRKKRHQGVD